MDLTTAAPTGFAAVFEQFVTYAGPVIQLLYWLAIGFAAIYAAVQFKRLVDAGIAAMAARPGHEGGAAGDTAAGKAADSEIDIDAFVE